MQPSPRTTSCVEIAERDVLFLSASKPAAHTTTTTTYNAPDKAKIITAG
jgi:hypothetical protein